MDNDNIAEVILESALEAGLEYRDYSGRAMYGKRCIAIEYEDKTEKDDFLYILRNGLGGDRPPSYRLDNLGLGFILYFPEIEYTEEG